MLLAELVAGAVVKQREGLAARIPLALLALAPAAGAGERGLSFKNYAQAGDTAHALEQLAVAIKRQPRQWKAQAAADPVFAKIKDQPAFAQLVK